MTPIARCFDPVHAPVRIQARDYRGVGKYPIVDQGQEAVGGWTDDPDGLVFDLPVIVFGDHTRVFKFVDFPFVRGADGTHLLKAKAGIDPRFLYYGFLSTDLPSRGYNRHFSLLKEQSLNLPQEPEQRDIARSLRLLEEAVRASERLSWALERTKQTAMRELFTRGLRGEDQKESDAGIVPSDWDVCAIEKHFLLSSGGTPSRSNALFWRDGVIPWVKTGEIDYRVIESTEEHITQEGLEKSAAKLLPPGTLLLAMYGQGITRGKVGILGIEACCNQACAAFRPLDDAILTKFLYYLLSHRYGDLRQISHGGQQQNLNMDILRGFPIG
jgi:type I restriction enzyme S subunit